MVIDHFAKIHLFLVKLFQLDSAYHQWPMMGTPREGAGPKQCKKENRNSRSFKQTQ